jgi:anti-anti-sigma factor
MVAVPLTDPRLLALRCDGCGCHLAGVAADVDSWPLLWDLAAEQGWAGDGDPHGVHHCPRCAAGTSSLLPAWAEPSGRLQARLLDLDKIVVCRLAGDVDAGAGRELRTLLTFLGDRHLHIVLDLDSKVLGILLRTRRALLRRGGTLCLAAPPHLVLALLDVLHLEGVFDVFGTSEEAVRHLLRAGDRGT